MQISSNVESMGISKSGINKNLEELNMVKAVAAAENHGKDNFNTWQSCVAKAPKNFPFACTVVVQAGGEPVGSARLIPVISVSSCGVT